MKLKLKKGAKVSFAIIILVILFVIYLAIKFIVYNSYVKNYNYVKDFYKDTKVLDKIDLEAVSVFQSIFLDDTYRIGLEYNSINKIDDNTYEITDLKNNLYKFHYVINDSKEDYKKYFQAINMLKNIKDNKLKVYSSIFKLASDKKMLELLKKNIPASSDIALVDGDAFNGYLYKTDNSYHAIIYGFNKEFSFKFTGDDITTNDIRVILSSLTKE